MRSSTDPQSGTEIGDACLALMAARRKLLGMTALAGAAAALLGAGTVKAQTVGYPNAAITLVSLDQVRGLSDPVPPPLNVAAINAQEVQALLASLNAPFAVNPCGGAWVASGTTLTSTRADLYGALPGNPCYVPGVGSLLLLVATAEHRAGSTVVGTLIDNSSGTPGTVSLRGIGTGFAALSVTAPDLAAARRSLLLSADGSGRRYFAGTAVITGGGPFVASDRILSTLLTGTDTYTFFTNVIGQAGQTVIVGTQSGCPSGTSTIGCTGGVTVNTVGSTTIGVLHIINTLYITTTVERTLTGGTTFYDAALTPLPIGAVHGAAQSAGFDAADHFLGRLGRADLGLGSDKRAHVWGEAWAGRTRFDAHGDAGRTSADGHGFLLGAAFAVSDTLTLGVAGEWGRTTLDVANTLTPESARADHLKGGVHARLALGHFSANAAAMIGSVDVDSAGASSLGTATGRYDATIKGVSGDAGYDIGAGAVTLRPNLGFALLDWRRGAFTEVGGPAPLTVARASGQQSRLMAGLSARGSVGALTLGAYARAVRVGGDRVAAVTTFDPQLPGVPFTVIGPDHGRTLGEYGGELSIALGANARAALGYDGRSSGGLTTHAGRVTVRVGF